MASTARNENKIGRAATVANEDVENTTRAEDAGSFVINACGDACMARTK